MNLAYITGSVSLSLSKETTGWYAFSFAMIMWGVTLYLLVKVKSKRLNIKKN